MSKKKAISILLTTAAGLLGLYFLFGLSDTHLLLAGRVEQLELENKKLHRDIRQFSMLTRQHRSSSHESLNSSTGDSTQIGDQDESINTDNDCDTIHITMVTVGYSTTRSVVTLIKSILFYRHNHLHFHFISDNVGQKILKTAFRTWILPAVDVSFYSAKKARDKVAWIPNSHYSGVFGLMKLILPDILPSSLNRVIALDTDLMLAANILSLWKYFDTIERERKLLGLVENQSDWYLGKLWENHKPWPALGRGFNTGVVLFNLKLMRERDWGGLWNEVATQTLLEYDSTALADQDIVNTILREHQQLHHVLPCYWNAQLSEHSLSDYCYRNADQFKLVHWNSPAKLQVENNYGPYFRNIYKMFESYDGSLFRTALLSCDHTSELTTHTDTVTNDPCEDFRIQRDLVYRTHPYYLDYDYKSVGDNDVTLVTQMSMDRLHMLETLCDHWTGPLSVALYASDAEMQQILDYISSSSLRDLKRLALHAVYKSHSKFYPVNYLRNVALNNVNTPYVFLSDIDFIPMEGIYPYLQEAVNVLGADNRALVVPAFETLLYKFNHPADKEQLLSMLQDGSVSTFRSNVWKQGHAQTNYEHWKVTDIPYKVKWAPDFEPYIVVQSSVSRYDQRFAGFGWNKVSHIMELEAQGYEFVVLPSVFMIHMSHAPSLDIDQFRRSRRYRDCVQVVKKEFQRELEERHPLVL